MPGLGNDQVAPAPQNAFCLGNDQRLVRQRILGIHLDQAALSLGNDFLADDQHVVIGQTMGPMAGIHDLACQVVARPNFAQPAHSHDFKPVSHLCDPTPTSRREPLGLLAVARKTKSVARKPINPDQGAGWFLPAVVAVCLVGVGAVLYLANNRESNRAVAPLVPVPSLGIEGDHWHQAFGVYACDAFQTPVAQELPSSEGIHTHGDGLIHIHPFSVSASGKNATLSAYFRTSQAQLTDTTYTPGPFEAGAAALDEAIGCNGQPATLQIAVWDDAFSTGPPDRIVTENLADFRFEKDAGAITLALVPDGVEIPIPPSAAGIGAYSPQSPLSEDTTPSTAPTDTSSTDTSEIIPEETTPAE